MPYFQVSTLTSSTVADFRITIVSYIASYKPADSHSTQIPTYTDWHYIDWLLTLLFLLRIVKLSCLQSKVVYSNMKFMPRAQIYILYKLQLVYCEFIIQMHWPYNYLSVFNAYCA